MCLVRGNINIYQKLCHEIRTHLHDSKATLTTTNTKTSPKQQYQPGGTALITRHQITTQTTMREYDAPYGRWSTIIIGPIQHQIAIISAYIVCQTPISPLRHKTAAYQQWKLMSQNKENGHPRQKAVRDLIQYITTLKLRGHTILLILDANTSRNQQKGIIQQLKYTCALKEAIDTKNYKIPTLSKGKCQVDFIMCSTELHHHISFGAVQEFGEICGSDHRSLIIDISLKSYIKTSIQQQKLPI